jgi:hypothetical protein
MLPIGSVLLFVSGIAFEHGIKGKPATCFWEEFKEEEV